MEYNEILNEHITIKELFEAMPVALALVNREGEYLLVNNALVSLGGVFHANLIGQKIGEISPIAELNSREDFKLFDAGIEVPDHELTINGDFFQVSVSPLRDNQGYAIAEMVAITNISKIKKIETQLYETNKKLVLLSNQDPLTALLNARGFYETIGNLIEEEADEQMVYSVFFIDIDRFKQINDTYGHQMGDAVLVQTAGVIKALCRDNDTIGRVGGDEFSVFLPKTAYKEAYLLAEALRAEIERLIPVAEDASLKITVSIGVAEGKGKSISLMDVQSKADCAMYTAKRKSGNQVSGVF
ncbi:GGDEF domain-containing protein [Aminipila butyrica]|uniref:GGDEF domain-containing protein n=1 Tax=Aminipila butyrica TaxID=433296 RepID=A0A858BUD9_9FIRM|nr:sensor domain-containing diguanylate cyclase [Aminipila butyrica]QIB68809.1 GGDEF domain-containing protein [Aminipila butyrica]